MRCLVLAASLLAACQPSGDVSPSTSTTEGDDGVTTQVASSSDTATTRAATTDSSDASADASTAADTTTGTTTGDDGSSDGTTGGDTSTDGTTGHAIKTCKKVDLLFLIVDAGELWDTAIALKALGPHLAERLEADFAGWDYHLMVANASGTWGNAACDKRCVEGDPCNVFPPYPCDYQPDVCDQTLGAGVTYAAGGGSANAPCAIDGDQRYVVSGQQDLAGVLECLIVVGAGGHMVDYPVARATLDAIDAPLNTQGACNDGFLRDDAYLVLFVLSTLPDFHAEGTPEEWATELKAHKGGKFDKIYFTGLFGGCSSPFGWKEYEPLNEWVSSLYNHTLDDACKIELVSYIDPALDYVLGDCQD